MAQLHLANMKLHGREDDLNLLKSKLVKLDDDSRPELLLVSGVSGTGMFEACRDCILYVLQNACVRLLLTH